MKTFKKIILAITVFFIVSSIGGYLYFDKKFTPSQNYLSVSDASDTIPITWVKNKVSPMAALLLPIKISGIETQFYMQFDSGSTSTIFYKNALTAINSEFKGIVKELSNDSLSANLRFNLEKITVSSKNFKVINYGEALDFKDTASNKIIGTIGTDFLEKKKAIINFKEGYCFFGATFPNEELEKELVRFEFKKRKIIIPSKINGENYNFLYDTGTSGFELVTSKKIWLDLAEKNQQITIASANSLGNTLKTFTIKSKKSIEFKNRKIPLTEVTYIEGTTFTQNLLMKFSGMGGVIGNKIFGDKILVLDCKNQKMGILHNNSLIK